MRRLIYSSALCASLLGTGTANAQFLTNLADKDCSNGRVSNEMLRERALSDAKVPLTMAVAQALVQGRLGGMAVRALECGLECKGVNKALNDLYFTLQPLIEDAPAAPQGFAVRTDGAGAPRAEDRAAAFLNGDWEWLRVTCRPTAPASSTAASGGRPARSGQGPGIDVILGKNEEDVGKAFDKRGFATLGYSNDFEADKVAWTVDAYLAFRGDALGKDREVEFQPYVSLQYNSSKKVDDLAFGGALIWHIDNGGDRIQLKGAWETDHRFDSSLWRADIGWSPSAFARACQRSNKLDTRYFICDFAAVADFEDVSSIGQKAALADVENFFRIGGEASITVGQVLSPKVGFVFASAGFAFRQDMSGDTADVERFNASIGLTPSKVGAWKVALEYTLGRDITSLAKEEKLLLSVGFRQ